MTSRSKKENDWEHSGDNAGKGNRRRADVGGWERHLGVQTEQLEIRGSLSGEGGIAVVSPFC